MRLVFIYGQVASGKLTVGRELAEITGLPLFHNHLVVDAVSAVFPFGTEPFKRLREEIWLKIVGEAARAERSLIFTIAPEPTVERGFAKRMQSLVQQFGGAALFVALKIEPGEQERRLLDPSRSAFGKLRSLQLLNDLRGDFARCMAEMPPPDLTIDTTVTPPRDAARRIAERMAS
ncbi:MAG: shikimate kinase [Proteobacteria bacterium]|nr:shikimate kinase [Pseudomonadota bacterium]